MDIDWLISEEEEAGLTVYVVLGMDVDLVKTSKVVLIIVGNWCSFSVDKVAT